MSKCIPRVNRGRVLKLRGCWEHCYYRIKLYCDSIVCNALRILYWNILYAEIADKLITGPDTHNPTALVCKYVCQCLVHCLNLCSFLFWFCRWPCSCAVLSLLLLSSTVTSASSVSGCALFWPLLLVCLYSSCSTAPPSGSGQTSSAFVTTSTSYVFTNISLGFELIT